MPPEADEGEKPGSLLDEAAGAKGDDTAEGGDQDTLAGDTLTGDTLEGAAAERPAWLTEDKFWDDDKKEFNGELLFKNYGELVGKFSRKEHEVPKEVADYKLDAIKPDVAKTLELGDAAELAENPLMKGMLADAHIAGLSQAQLNVVLAGFLGRAAEVMPDNVFDGKAEVAKLGPNGQALVDSLFTWGNGMVKDGVWNDDDFDEFRVLCGTAEGCRMIQKLRELHDPMSAKIPTHLPGDPAIKSEAELQEMVGDPRYGPDVAFTAKVDAAFEKKHGTEPAGSSKPSTPAMTAPTTPGA